jgi:hypothetical protein
VGAAAAASPPSPKKHAAAGGPDDGAGLSPTHAHSIEEELERAPKIATDVRVSALRAGPAETRWRATAS